MLALAINDVVKSDARQQVIHSIITDTMTLTIFLTDIQEATKRVPDLHNVLPLVLSWNHAPRL